MLAEKIMFTNSKIDEAISILRKIEWVGTGAKYLIEEAIGTLLEAKLEE